MTPAKREGRRGWTFAPQESTSGWGRLTAKHKPSLTHAHLLAVEQKRLRTQAATAGDKSELQTHVTVQKNGRRNLHRTSRNETQTKSPSKGSISIEIAENIQREVLKDLRRALWAEPGDTQTSPSLTEAQSLETIQKLKCEVLFRLVQENKEVYSLMDQALQIRSLLSYKNNLNRKSLDTKIMPRSEKMKSNHKNLFSFHVIVT